MLVSDLGGLPEAVRHGENGLIFRGGDATDLARNMLRVVKNPGQPDAMRRNIGPVTSISETVTRLEEILAGCFGSLAIRGVS